MQLQVLGLGLTALLLQQQPQQQRHGPPSDSTQKEARSAAAAVALTAGLFAATASHKDVVAPQAAVQYLWYALACPHLPSAALHDAVQASGCEGLLAAWT
jgi:hypothetical protein